MQQGVFQAAHGHLVDVAACAEVQRADQIARKTTVR
jgi:hypothetical protein